VEPEAPDLNMCLIHQKLQLLNVCIYRYVEAALVEYCGEMDLD